MAEDFQMPDTGHVRLGSSAGQAPTRRDGVLKITGGATYAADNRPAGLLHAVCATAGIARGRVVALDVAAAMAHPGVVEVITPDNRPPLALHPDEKIHRFDLRTEALQDDLVRYAGQPVAMVLAETLEAATEGARLLAPQYAVTEAPVIGFEGESYPAETVSLGMPGSFDKGDVEAALAGAAHITEGRYETSMMYHNAIEPHAIVAQWVEGRLVIDTPNQAIGLARQTFAAYLGVPPEDVLIRSPFIGGGFGSKAMVYGAQLLTGLAAKMTGRPVKMVLRRDQLYGPITYRAATRQDLKLATDADGRLVAISHEVLTPTSRFEDFLEPAGNTSKNIYASPAIRIRHQGIRNDVGTPGPMRAPGEATGSAAMEVAMDEAAEAHGLDPLEFRLRNYAETDPGTGRAFSSKALRECYAEAAAAFGWEKRPLAPRQMRDDAGMLVGWGMGSCLFPAPMFQAEARATLRADGTALIETSAADMGQGAWTALAQIAADGLGVDLDRLEFRSGHSDLPDAGVAGGSGHTATAGEAMFKAGADAVGKLAELALNDPASPLFGAGNAGVIARGGRLIRRDDDSRSETYEDILARAGLSILEGRGTGARSEEAAASRAMFSHGAVFAEVKVDPDLGQIRVSRLLGAFAAGRIINPRLARSQLLGGMIWGMGFALHEEALHDPRTGRPVSPDLAGYHVPVNADVPQIEALTVHEDDPFVNTLGIKGVGEIGITGTVGAIANAIWHATGVRPHHFPVHPETLVL